ncbi:phage major head subunit gpT-like protein [Haloferula luteola]|uniref:Phage major head subunit gpT-like protein n=1 Tax=Haloferula luteola TaxID=595692 RepID=A0A840VMW2_9BACT|nr:hypothetical protein [Haloferula luteola]MBB5353951.1 phage major head subunit gpT-like protein [Haloferula luteola]
MSAIHKALIEAIVYLVVAEGSDDRKDDDVRALESVFAELGRATSNELDCLFAAVRAELKETQNPARVDALESIIDSLSD